MGYRNSYQKDPHERLNDEWNNYAKSLSNLENQISNLNFNFFADNNLNEEDNRWNLEKNTALHTKLFLLPKEYQVLEIKHFLKYPKKPEKLEILIQPELHLELSEYPQHYFKKEANSSVGYFKLTKEVFDSFFGKNASPSEDPKFNKFQNEISERRKIISKAEELQKKIDSKYQELNEIEIENNQYLINLSLSTSEKDVCKFLEIVNSKHVLPLHLRNEIVFQLFKESKTLVIQFKFPDYSDEKLIIDYTKNRVPKLATHIQKKKLIKQCLYSMMIRIGHLAAIFNIHDLYKSLIINVEQDWFDPATGQQRNGVIATLQASCEYMKELNLAKLDAESCFKYLKGISVPSYDNLSPIRPIFVLNKEDERFVENKEIYLEEEANLASMEWEDFEHLVAQLFEWEFAKNGIEVKVTRASRDRGVDAILFDPDPFRGGKYVLQAKRYTRTVDVSAVRDLYGTIMNEGANRGIIITTASFGPDAYEFSKDKPISLVDGPNLLLMLQKHGKKFRIDLEEARRLNIENQQ